jgi:hypothetical protein
MGLITIFCCTFFIADDLLINQSHYSLPYLLACLTLSTASLWLNREGFFGAAKILLALMVNATIFVFSEIEPLETGQFMFYIPAAICALVLWQEEKKAMILFVTLPTLLFLTSLVFEFDLLPSRALTHEYIDTSLFINFTLALIACSCSVIFLVKVNTESEKILTESNNEISKKNLELVRLNKQLDRFFYSTSHDLRGPLTSILGLIHLALKENDLEQVRNQLALMSNRIHHLDAIVGNIVDYARNVRQDVYHDHVLLAYLMDNTVQKAGAMGSGGQIEIINQLPVDLFVISDEQRLEIVFINIISNALKYADPHKNRKYVRIFAEITEKVVKVSFEDNGVGISGERLPLIFNMFVKAHEKSSGAGLGLYVVRETLEKIGGRITATSQVGVGSVFTVELPRTSSRRDH